ncbi:MAG TPA: hypothetical protein VGO58_13905 [Chitinophagaceae bacterium]|jgi:hypothetical protein|nr:hypothetical protein [Chitinophagaceae bacterium]
MRKLFILLAIIFCNYCHAQIDSVYIALGQSEKMMINFMNQLNSRKPNPRFSVQRDTLKNGNPTLSAEFKPKDQSFYKCLNIRCIFEKVEDKEYCISQLIHASLEYLDHYIGYLNRNFALLKENVWEKDKFNNSNDLKIQATLTRLPDETFVLVFDLIIKG